MIKTEIKNQLAWLMLDRPKQKNALSIELLMDLRNKLQDLESKADVRVIILYGQSDFSAGGDIHQMKLDSLESSLAMAHKVQTIYQDIEKISKPVIAYTSGIVFGGGFELALVCDFILSDKDARFSLPETALGIVPGGGATQRLKQRIGKQNATYVLMTGNRFSSKKMLDLGVVQEIVKDKDAVEDIALSIAKNNSTATKSIKALLRLDNDFQKESEIFSELLQGEGKGLIKAFLERDRELKS